MNSDVISGSKYENNKETFSYFEPLIEKTTTNTWYNRLRQNIVIQVTGSMAENEDNKILFSSAINQGLYEVLGDEESVQYRILLNSANLAGQGFEEIRFMQKFLLEKFGSTDSEGISICIGQSSYHFIKNFFEKTLKFQNQDFRFLPSQRRIESALEKFRLSFFPILGFDIEKTEQDESFVWKIDDALFCGSHCAYLISGILQEMLTDISGGRYFPIFVNPLQKEKPPEIHISKRALGH